MDEDEVNQIICQYVDKIDIPDEFYKAIIFMRDMYFTEKKKNKKLQEENEQINGQYKILVDDLDEHNIVYIDEPEFKENFISKDKIREKIKELDRNELMKKYNYEETKLAMDILKELL